MSDVNDMHNNVNNFLKSLRELLNEHGMNISGDAELYCSKLGYLGSLEDDESILEVVIGEDVRYSSN